MRGQRRGKGAFGGEGADCEGMGGEIEGGDEGSGDEGGGGEGEGGEGEGGFQAVVLCVEQMLNVEQVEREHDAGERCRGESSQSAMTPRIGVGAAICASGASRTSEEALRW